MIPPLDDHAVCLREAARRKGVSTDVVMGSRYMVAERLRPWLRLRFGHRCFFFAGGVLLDGARRRGASLGTMVNGRADLVARDKGRTNALLRAADVPAPEGRVFRRGQHDEVASHARQIGGPVCVKPTTGSYGFLVTPNLVDPDRIVAAYARTAERFPEVLIERSVQGVDVRCFFVWPRVVAMVVALPPAVTGDGQATIATLVERKNAQRAARALPGCKPIVVDADLAAVLATEGLTLDSVPPAGRTVILRHVVNRAVGGECINPVGMIHESYARVAEAACRVVPDLRISAVDMKVDDPARPAAAGNHCVLEVNASAGLLPFHYPWEGPAQDIAGAIVDYLGGLAVA